LIIGRRLCADLELVSGSRVFWAGECEWASLEFSFGPIRSKRPWSLSKQCILVDDNLGVAPCTDVAVIGPYPVDGFGCRLMAARAGNFDTLIVEQVVWPALRYFDRPPY
jgi:hypothetical protein